MSLLDNGFESLNIGLNMYLSSMKGLSPKCKFMHGLLIILMACDILASSVGITIPTKFLWYVIDLIVVYVD